MIAAANWIGKHLISFSMVMIDMILFSLHRYTSALPSPFKTVISLFESNNFEELFCVSIFALLLCGVESSIGSVVYCIWTFWSAAFLFIFRKALHSNSVGPSYLVFCPMATFLQMHEKRLSFKLFCIHFSDSELYAVAALEFCVFDFRSRASDLIGCMISNMIFKALVNIRSRLVPTTRLGVDEVQNGLPLGADPLSETER